MNRRDFLKAGMAGVVFLSLKSLGCAGPSSEPSGASSNHAGTEFDLFIGEGLFEMVDGRKVFMWSFQGSDSEPRMPGPLIQVNEGDPVIIHVHNTLREEHAFTVMGVNGSGTGVIRPGKTATVTFNAPAAGTYLYHDPLNSPVNRVLGLHGPMVVLPKSGNTPYGTPTATLQRLFDDLGTTSHFPRHAHSPAGWQPERSRIWLMHQVDPVFNDRAERGTLIDPAEMRAEFLPRYFTINGKSGVFASHDPDTVIKGRIGQPMLVRILNAGLFTHSNHLHANHFYVTAVNGVVRENILFLDSYHIFPEDRVDWLVPFVRPPDIPGDQNIPLRDLLREELKMVLGDVPQSPLIYPMHCHMEPSQTAAGGNYPQGTVTHMDFLGDVDGVDFPDHGGM